MHSPMFYLSRDKSYLMNEQGSNMYSLVQEDDRTYYKPIAIESDSIDKICIRSTIIRVCSLWGRTHECLEFEHVYVCTQWELIPKGYANVS
jgi:hypothetical protein